jgi:protein SCO1/2
MTPIARTVLLCLVFVALVLGSLFYNVTRVPVLNEEQLRELGVFILPRPRELAPFELQTHRGESFTRESLAGQWSFIFFGFTNCPDICPTTMAVMGIAERDIAGEPRGGDPFQGMLVSVDPERDDATTLGRYVEAFSPRFIGVRGDRDATVALTTQVNVAFAQVPDGSGGYQVDHSANIVIINPRGHYHGFIRMPHKAETLVLAYRSLAATF